MVLIIVVAVLFLATSKPALTSWEQRQLWWWCKCTYGLLSLPYLFYALPLMHLLFQSAPASGYNDVGECVRMKKQLKQQQPATHWTNPLDQA